MKDEIIFAFIAGMVGFFIGGAIGAIWFTGFSPYCWYGAAAAAFGIIFVDIGDCH
jgi:hypothetical protein